MDAYQSWQPEGPGAPDHPTAKAYIVNFVKDLATYARETRAHSDLQVFVQNAEELSDHPDYVQAASDIGKADLFYNGNRHQPAGEVERSVDQLDRFKQAGKPVPASDYVTEKATRTATSPTTRAAPSTP